MLSIGKLGASRDQLEYYDAQVAAGAEDYYAGRGESPGRWTGSGTRALGLEGGVDRDSFLALMHGRHPDTGKELRRAMSRSTVAALDLTFSAPKSVSVLYAIADENVSAVLLRSHERAVGAAVGYLEREACWTRRGHGGTERLRGEGFVAAAYRHRMSRAGDPQLHTHVVVANLTRADGRYTTLEAHSLYEHKSAAGALYRTVLRAEVRDELPWAHWRTVSRGLFELTGVPDPVLRHFSQRRVEIEEAARELAGGGALSREQMQRIALATRRAKQYGVSGATWREQACARAAEHGFGARELTALQGTPASEPELGDDFAERLASRLSGPEGLARAHNTFAARHAVAEIACAFEQGVRVEELDDATAGYLRHATVFGVRAGSGGEPRFTTTDLLARERAILDSAARRRGEQTAVLHPSLVRRALDLHTPALNADQAAAVRALATSGHGVEAVQALAGTGKTTMLGALAACYRQAGYHVVGAAPTAAAARELRGIAGIPASTIHALLNELGRSGGLHSRTVLVIDEAGMAPTRLTAALFAATHGPGVKIIAIGDSGQLRSVEAGGWLAALTRQHPGPELREVMRQHDPAERQALTALRDGNPDRYLAHKHNQGTLVVHEHETDAVRDLAQAWHGAQRVHGPAQTMMIARDNTTREQLNHAARDLLKNDGLLPRAGLEIAGREFCAGDRVIARRNDRYRKVDNGTRGTIVDIHPGTATLTVEADSGGWRTLDHQYVAEHLEHAYALTGHGSQGGTVTWAAAIGRPTEFTREWAYTALSRARETTSLHIITERTEHQRERDDYAPPQPEPHPADAIIALHRAMTTSEAEPFAAEQLEPEELPDDDIISGPRRPGTFSIGSPQLPCRPGRSLARREHALAIEDSHDRGLERGD